MAALTTRLGFITGVLILPQRQTALVAKQAAALDVLSGGRLRLGIGTGWNEVEYVALGEDFHTRGQRSAAQIALLRRLWTEPLVTVDDGWHTIPDAGLNPLPVQRPIPIWLGGYADAVLERVATLGDGWLPGSRTAAEAAPSLAKIDEYLAAAGRTRQELGLEPRIHLQDGHAPERWAHIIEEWGQVGATHLSVSTMGCGFHSPAEHIAALEAFSHVILPTQTE